MEQKVIMKTDCLTKCHRCQEPQCRGNSIYDCCDIENPNWIKDWVYRMYQSNQNKPKYLSDFSKWENQFTKETN